jgi:hypothetical protein
MHMQVIRAFLIVVYVRYHVPGRYLGRYLSTYDLALRELCTGRSWWGVHNNPSVD